MPIDDSTPYSTPQLVGAILGAIFGTGLLLLSIVYFLRKRTKSRYTPVKGDQDPAAEEFNFHGGRRSPEQVPMNHVQTTSQSQYTSHPTRDTGVSSAQYPTWGSAASSGRAGTYPRITITSPTNPSISSYSIESHHNVQRHLISSTQEDTRLPPRPSSPIPNGYVRSGYLPVEESDEEDVDYDPGARFDAPNLNSGQGLLNKMKDGALPAIPIGASRPSHARTESRVPLIQTDLAPQSTRPRPEQEPQPQPQSQSHIQLSIRPPPEPPTTKPLVPIIVPPPFPPPSHPPPLHPPPLQPPPLDDRHPASRTDNHLPDTSRDKAHSSVQEPPTPVGVGSPETLTNISAKSQTSKSQTSDAYIDQPTTNPSPNHTSPSISSQVRPRPIDKTAERSERSYTWFSIIGSSSSQSRQNSMDSPLPSSKALSHGAHGEKEPATELISPDKSLSPDSASPSTGGPTPSSFEFPLPPGALPLQHTKSDPYPPTFAAGPSRPRKKSTLSNVVATATDIEVKNGSVGLPMVSVLPAQSIAEGLRSDSPNGVISKRSKGGLMTTESQARARKPITPEFFDNPEDQQKKLEPGTDMRGESVGSVSLLSGIPMILAGSLKKDSERRSGESTESATHPRMEGSAAHRERESLNSNTSYVTDDETETVERAEIKTAALVVRSPPRNVPELARWDTIHQMSDPEERARDRSRSGSNATASGSMRKRKSPDDSPPPMPIDVRERQGDSLDLSSRATSIVEGQLVAIPMSLANRASPLVPWTPSPAATPLRLDHVGYSASSQQTTFHPSDIPPWQPLRLHSPPRDEQRSPSTPPSVPPIPELPPISFEDFIMAGPPVQQEDVGATQQSSQTEPAVVTVHEASPIIGSEVNESGWQPGHASDSSTHSQGTADTFGLSATKSMRGVSRRGPRPIPTQDREPSGSGASIASMSHQNTGSHGTSGSGSQNEGYIPVVDYVFGPPPPVLEQSEPDTSSESHTTVPAPRKSSPKPAPPMGLMTPVSRPTSANPPPQTTTPSSSSARVASTLSGLTRRAVSARPAVGIVRGPRDRSSSARAVLASSSSSSYSQSMNNRSRPLSSSSVPTYGSLTPGNAAGSSNPKTDSMNSNNSILDLYAQSPPRSNTPTPDPHSLLSNGHTQSRPS